QFQLFFLSYFSTWTTPVGLSQGRNLPSTLEKLGKPRAAVNGESIIAPRARVAAMGRTNSWARRSHLPRRQPGLPVRATYGFFPTGCSVRRRLVWPGQLAIARRVPLLWVAP